MKKIVYETGDVKCPCGENVVAIEQEGYHVTLSRHEPEKPVTSQKCSGVKGDHGCVRPIGHAGEHWCVCGWSWNDPAEPEIERCEIFVSPNDGPMYCLKHGTFSMQLSHCLDDSDFAGFEFEDGITLERPWRGPPALLIPGITHITEWEHAKYVLFRRCK